MEQLVFVYGTLKAGRGNHRVMGDSQMLAAHTTDAKYTMRTCGSFPIVERDGTTAIKGEVYKVTDEPTLKGIFRLEGYSGTQGDPQNWYDTDIIETPFGKASIFVMPKDTNVDLPILETGIF